MVVLIILLGTRATGTLVHLGGDGVGDVGQLLLLLLEVLSVGSASVLLEPVGSLLDSVKNLEIRLASACSSLLMGKYKLTVSFSSSSILPPRPSSSLTWFFRLKA